MYIIVFILNFNLQNPVEYSFTNLKSNNHWKRSFNEDWETSITRSKCFNFQRSDGFGNLKVLVDWNGFNTSKENIGFM